MFEASHHKFVGCDSHRKRRKWRKVTFISSMSMTMQLGVVGADADRNGDTFNFGNFEHSPILVFIRYWFLVHNLSLLGLCPLFLVERVVVFLRDVFWMGSPMQGELSSLAESHFTPSNTTFIGQLLGVGVFVLAEILGKRENSVAELTRIFLGLCMQNHVAV